MPIEHKPHRASSSVLAHLDGLLDELLEQTFPASDLSRSISSVNHTTLRHEPQFPRSHSLATGRSAADRRDTDAYPTSARRLTAEMRSKPTVVLTAAATFGPDFPAVQRYETPVGIGSFSTDICAIVRCPLIATELVITATDEMADAVQKGKNELPKIFPNPRRNHILERSGS